MQIKINRLTNIRMQNLIKKIPYVRREFETHRRHCVVPLSKILNPLPSTGQKKSSRQGCKIVNWDVKHKNNISSLGNNGHNYEISTSNLNLMYPKVSST